MVQQHTYTKFLPSVARCFPVYFSFSFIPILGKMCKGCIIPCTWEASKRGWPHGFWVWVLLLQFLQVLSASFPLAPRWQWVPCLPQPPQGLGLLPPRRCPALHSHHLPFILPLSHPHLWAPSLCFSVSAFFSHLFPSSGSIPLLSGGESCLPDCFLWLWLEWQNRGRGSSYWLSSISFKSVWATKLHFI